MWERPAPAALPLAMSSKPTPKPSARKSPAPSKSVKPPPAKARPAKGAAKAPARAAKTRPKHPLELASPAEFSSEVMEFLTAVDTYKRKHGRPFPHLSEVFQIVKSLGYHKSA